MDNDKDDKSIIDKTLEAVKDIAAIASEAAHKAMEPEPLKPGDEVVVMPMAPAGFMGEAVMPPFVIIPRRTNAPSQIAKEAPQRTAKKSTGKTDKKPAKKSSKEENREAAEACDPAQDCWKNEKGQEGCEEKEGEEVQTLNTKFLYPFLSVSWGVPNPFWRR